MFDPTKILIKSDNNSDSLHMPLRITMDAAPDNPLNFRQRSIFFYNSALSKYYNEEFQASRLDLNRIICHRHSIMEQALALERLDWAFGFEICCLSLELSIKLKDQNAFDVMEFYYLTHLKLLNLLCTQDVLKIEAILSLYKLALGVDPGNISFGHFMELWKLESSLKEPDVVRFQIRNLNNVGCLLGTLIAINM